MLGLIQRVSSASVVVNNDIVGHIATGLLLFLGIEKDDTSETSSRLLDKIVRYRVFPDDRGQMNLSLLETGGELLIVSQFTLAANTKKGLRPSFSGAAEPAVAERLYDEFVALARQQVEVQTGQFGADMKVSLTNDGPVTFLLSTS